LATIRDGFEQSYLSLLTYLQASQYLKPWIGLIKENANEYKWVDKWPVEYVNWGAGFSNDASAVDSNRSCAFIESSSGAWNVSACDQRRSFICKVSTEPLPTTTTPGKNKRLFKRNLARTYLVAFKCE
jgi:hypothetical protein